MIRILSVLMFTIIWFVGQIIFCYADAPKFETQFANYLINKEGVLEQWVENVFDKDIFQKADEQEKIFDPASFGIDRNQGIRQNIINIFYPQSYENSGRIRELIKNAMIGFMIIFMFLSATDLLLHTKDADPEQIKASALKFAYIIFGWLLVFGSWWLLAQIGIRWADNNIQWTAWIIQWLQWQYDWDEWSGLYNQTSGIFFDVINTVKAFSFFVAIVMIARYGFQVIRWGMDDTDTLSTAKQWVINIVVALVVIRVIDFVYYIAMSPSFNSEAINTLMIVATYVWYIIGALFIIVLIYAGIKIITSNGDETSITTAKTYVINMFLIGITILLFLLIVYQVMQEIV